MDINEILDEIRQPITDQVKEEIKQALKEGRKYVKHYHQCSGDGKCDLDFLIGYLKTCNYTVTHHTYKGWLFTHYYIYITW